MAKHKKKSGSIAPPAPPESGLKLKILKTIKSPWTILVLLMLLGLGFRLATTRFTPLLYPDSLEYLSLAKEIQSGAFFHADYNLDQGFLRSRRLPPLYSAMLACFPGLTDSGEYIGGLISILFSLATFFPAFWLGRRLHSTAAGLVAAGLMSFQWFILRYASPVLTEAAFTFWFTLALALGFQAVDRKTPRSFALAGLVSSLAYLTRDVGLTLVFLIGAFAGLRLCLYDRLPWRRLLPLLGALLAVFALVCFPYWLLIRAHTGRWGLTVQMGNEAITDHILKFGGNRADRDRLPGLEEGTESLESETGLGSPALHKNLPALAFKVLSLSGDYTRQYFKSTGLFLSLFLLAALGWAGVRIIRRPRSPAAIEELYFWVWIVHLVALYALLTPYMVDERYMYPIMIPGMVAVGVVVARLAQGLARRLTRAAAWAAPVASIVFLVLAFGTLWPDPGNGTGLRFHYLRMSNQTLARKYASGYKEAAEQIKARGLVPPGKMIISRKPFVAYYLEGQFALLPKTLEETQALIADGKADYLAVDSFTLMSTRQLLRPLAFPDAPHSPWPVVYNQSFPQYRRTITIYDLKSKNPQAGCASPQSAPVERLAAARNYLSQGQIYAGLCEARAVLESDPRNLAARFLVMDAYRRYLEVSGDSWVFTELAPTMHDYLEVNPSDQTVKAELAQVMEHLEQIGPRTYIEKQR
jgi:4-amino-4-deoxy-L-arabinose transferase-like glycosyltransferase